MTQSEEMVPGGPWILTRSGRAFNYGNPTMASVHLPDIIHALSNCCRFNGHVRSFFSVAQHTGEGIQYILDTYPLDIRDDVALAFAHHDFHEAYITDIATPLKLVFGPVVKEIEARIDNVIFRKFGVTEIMKAYKDDVKEVDKLLLWSDAIRWGCDGIEVIDGVEVQVPRIWVPEDFEPLFADASPMPPWQAKEYLSNMLKHVGYTGNEIRLGRSLL